MNISNFKKFAEDLASKAQALASTPEGRAKVEEFRKAVNNFSHNNYIMNALATNQNIDESTNPLISAFYTFVGNPANQAKTWLVELGQGNKSKINKMLAEHPELAYYSSGLTRYGRPETMHLNDELKYVPKSSKTYLEDKDLQDTISNMGSEITTNGLMGAANTAGLVLSPGIGGTAGKVIAPTIRAATIASKGNKLRAAVSAGTNATKGLSKWDKTKLVGGTSLGALGVAGMADNYSRATAKDNLFNRFNKANPEVDINKEWDNASDEQQRLAKFFLLKNFGTKAQGPTHRKQYSPAQEKYLAKLTSKILNP